MTRIIALLYGLIAYLIFFATILYAIGFVDRLFVPKHIDSGPESPWVQALWINLSLMTLFAVQHSVMARKSFKRWWTQYVPAAVERSTYVVLASLSLVLLFWLWQPMPAILWNIQNQQIVMIVMGASMLGWFIVFTSTFLINHFELFGLQQVVRNLSKQELASPTFRTPLYYQFVRHPIYLGFIIAFWATPTMTVGHLLFAAGTTAYIFVGIYFEERDLVDLFGDDYRRYRDRVAMLLPLRKTPQPIATPPRKPVELTTER